MIGDLLLSSPFQFHKGTIRTSSVLSTISQITYFNSIKVRLEQLERKSDKVYQQFQFHKGTIRTPFKAHPDLARKLFQFHKGTIRTLSKPNSL